MKPQPIGFGLMLQLTAMAVLRDLDLTDCMLGLGSRIDRLQGDNAKTERTVLDLAYRNGQFGLGVHLTIPFNILHDAVVAAGVPMRCATDVSSARSSGSGVLQMTEEGSEIRRFDLVVDASGAISCLSDPKQVGSTRNPLSCSAFWATLDWCGDGFDQHALQLRYDTASVMIGVLPIGQ
ncbi:MAG: FAD-dependent oxidoreductase [Rhizobiaceae bacterium]